MQTCTKADDWEANFRASKARGQVLYSPYLNGQYSIRLRDPAI